MNNHKQIKPDIVQTTIDLLNQYNYTKELTAIMTRNFNEIDPNPAEIEACGVGERDPHKLHNKISNQVVENFKRGIVSEKIDFKNFPEKKSEISNFKAGKVSKAIDLDKYGESVTEGTYGSLEAKYD